MTARRLPSWWVRVATDALGHPKMRAAGPDGALLWLAGLGWSAQYGTDGHLPAEMLPVLAENAWANHDPRGLAARLVACELWHEVEGGWEIHGFEEWQERKDERAEAKRRKAERMRKWREQQRASGSAPRSAPRGRLVGPLETETETETEEEI